VDQVPENSWDPLPLSVLAEAVFKNPVQDFYLTNAIARASPLMADLSARSKTRRTQPLAAE
jgi:NADH-quinone oxidoreductase subunit G